MGFELRDVNELVKEAMELSLKYYHQNKITEAEVVLTQLLKVDEENVDAMDLLGLCKHKQHRQEEAIELFNKVLEIDNTRSFTHNNLGLCYSSLGEYEKAIEYMGKAVELDPSHDYMYINLAIQYNGLGDFDKVVEYFDKAIETNPDNPGNWYNMGSVYGRKKHLEKAMECFDKAIELNPEMSPAYVDKGYSLALMGRFSEAWPLLFKRLDYFPPVKTFKDLFNFDKMWKGEDPKGKRIVIWCEQGVGDTIMFSRFIQDLQERGATVLHHCPRVLLKMAEVNDWGDVIQEDCSKEEYDYHCSIMDLPMRLNTTDYSLKKKLKSSREADFSQYENLYKIGIVWAGNPRHPRDRNRSVKLNFFKPIHNIKGVKLFNLQKDLRARAYSDNKTPVDLTEGCEDMKIVDCSPFLEDFDDTAALINEMDLVISADTSVLHIAASMEKPTWAIIPYNPDWRWTIEGEDSIWYPTLRLFRQEEQDNWDYAFDKMTKKIKALTND